MTTSSSIVKVAPELLTTISPLSPSLIAPSAPSLPAGPWAPVSPLGIVKLKVAALDDPEFVTVAEDPAAPVVTVPTAMVAAAPSLPSLPAAPVAPVAPVSPFGIVKLNVAALDVPEFVTEALVPAFPVVVLPTAIVAAAPSAPSEPSLPAGP